MIAGLWALTGAGHDDDTLVLVHDAARPARHAGARRGRRRRPAATVSGAVVPIVPVVDSLKRVRGERVVAPVERDEVVAAQTPQAARLGALRAAIEEAHAWGRPITDDAGALAAAGVPVHVVPGDPANRKLTEPADLVPMRAQLAAARDRHRARRGVRRAVGDRLRRPSARRRPADAPRRRRLPRRAARAGGPLGRGRRAPRAHRRAARRGRARGRRHALPVRRCGVGGRRLGGPARRARSSACARAGWRPAAADLVVVVARPSIARPPRRDRRPRRGAARRDAGRGLGQGDDLRRPRVRRRRGSRGLGGGRASSRA